MSRTYLYVPYAYKDQAKKSGAKWDSNKKKWFVSKLNPHFQSLVDLFDAHNFVDSYYGTKMKSNPTTAELKERLEK